MSDLLHIIISIIMLAALIISIIATIVIGSTVIVKGKQIIKKADYVELLRSKNESFIKNK